MYILYSFKEYTFLHMYWKLKSIKNVFSDQSYSNDTTHIKFLYTFFELHLINKKKSSH